MGPTVAGVLPRREGLFDAERDLWHAVRAPAVGVSATTTYIDGSTIDPTDPLPRAA